MPAFIVPPTAFDDLLALLRQVRRRWQAARLLRAAAAGAGAAAAAVVLLLAADRWLPPADALLAALLGAALLLAGGGAVWAVRRLRKSPDDGQVARYIEERCPSLQDRLSSAADVIRGARPSPFRALVVRDAVRHARDVDPGQVVPRRDLRRPLVQAAAAAAVLLLVLALGSGRLGRLGSTAFLYAFPYTATLHVEPGHARVPAGRPLRLAARLDAALGIPPRTPPVVVMTDAAGARQTVAMAAAGDGAWRLEIPAVDDSFAYRVRAASLVSERYDVTALRPPRVERIDVAYRYPPAIGLPPRVEIDGGDVQAPPGTRVTVTVRMSRPVEQAVLARAAGGPLALAPADGPRILAGSFELKADDTYRIDAVDADGMRNPAGIDYFIRALRDMPPAVEILRPGGDREITPLEEVVVEARAEDDYGLRQFELVYGVPGRLPRVVSLQPGGGALRAAGAHTIFAEDLALEPGRFLTYHVRARDTGAGETRSDIYFLQVRPFGREFEEARSQESGGMPADELGRLTELQKEIAVAVWKLDSLPPAERAPEDLETVADAQNDVALATRAVASRLRPPAPAVDDGGRGEVRGMLAALDAALDAMAAAEAELRAGRTGEAVPHAMAALEQLLQARGAAVRTQVQPPESSPGGNGRMPQEDLSALFDRELRRDQQTNYENRSREPEPSADAEEEALRRRLQELARRQEDLNRQQQALADGEVDGQPAERMLERLAREQAELRRQMEALGRELVQPERQGAARPPDARAARAAAEQMRRAADELGRGDPAQAAERGRQALDGLRELGRSLGESGAPRAGQQEGTDDRAQLAAELEAARELRRRLAEIGARPRGAGGARSPDGDAQPEAGETGGGEPDPAGADRAEQDSTGTRHAEAGETGRGESDPAEADRPGQDPAGIDRAEQNQAGTERAAADVAETGRGESDSARSDGAQPGLAGVGAGIEGVLEELARQRPDLRSDLEQWARHWWSGAAPGNDAGRQDLSAWTSLYGELTLLLDEFEASRTRALAEYAAGERPSLGTDPALPAPYRRMIDQYYRSLAEQRPAR